MVGLGFTACTDINEEERFDGPQAVEAKKNVLIEDFTGQRCTNCPLAADEIQTLQQTYGSKRLIAVSIHGGQLSLDEDTYAQAGLANAQGLEYNTHWGLESWPKGMVDRSGGLIDYEQWNGAALRRFSIAPKVDLSVPSLSYNEEERTVFITVDVKGNDNVSGKLQVWLTESDITALQFLPESKGGGYDRNYTHNHVFRASVNEPYGESMTVAGGEIEERQYNYTLPHDYWKAENMAAVIFFYNEADGVMQVIDTKLIK